MSKRRNTTKKTLAEIQGIFSGGRQQRILEDNDRNVRIRTQSPVNANNPLCNVTGNIRSTTETLPSKTPLHDVTNIENIFSDSAPIKVNSKFHGSKG